MAFLGQEEQIREFQDRFRYLYVVLFLGLGLLVSRLVYLQILEGDKMRRYSEENRIRRVKVAAPRGMIFDRNQNLLIDNRPAFDLEVIPQYLFAQKEKQAAVQVIALLARILHIKEADINDTLDRAKTQPSFMPVKIKTDLTRDEVATVESWKINMPGVEVKEEIKRTNVYGDVAAHLLGYIGEVNTTELPNVNHKTQTNLYKLGDSIGKFGLEQKMEEELRGIDGEEIKEVDALGRVKLDKSKGRVIGSANPDKPAVPGRNLILTIDQDLQLAATKAFGEKIGSLVAIDPRNGQILAMLSRPSFDPTEFSRGIPAETWRALLTNDNHPLRDKTIQDHYPPGSTFKIVTAIAGLEEGAIDENTTFGCGGQLRTNIQLPREIPGLIPTEEWKMKRFHQEWNPGETVSVAIGQSFVLTTVIQLANLYAAVANGGTLYRPYFVKEIQNYEREVKKRFEPEVLSKFKMKARTLELVRQGIWGAVNMQHGTAYASRLPGMDFAGKTGSAQVVRQSADKRTKCENAPFHDRDNAVFVGVAPLNDPMISVAVIAEHACHGASGAAPIARAVVKAYLEKYRPDLYSEKAIKARLKDHPDVAYVAPARPSAEDDEDTTATPESNQLLPEHIQPAPLPPGPAPGAGPLDTLPADTAEPTEEDD